MKKYGIFIAFLLVLGCHTFGSPSNLEIARSGKLAFWNFNIPEKMVIFKDGKKIILAKDDKLFNEVLVLTRPKV